MPCDFRQTAELLSNNRRSDQPLMPLVGTSSILSTILVKRRWRLSIKFSANSSRGVMRTAKTCDAYLVMLSCNIVRTRLAEGESPWMTADLTSDGLAYQCSYPHRIRGSASEVA